jgi:hypothetical protein
MDFDRVGVFYGSSALDTHNYPFLESSTGHRVKNGVIAKTSQQL